MNFNSDYILENEIVLLRPLCKEDAKNLISFSLNEPEIWKHSLIQPTNQEKLNEYINLALGERENEKSYPFIVFDKRENKYAGCTRFYNVNLFHKSCMLGYTWYGKHFQGTGLNKHCKYLLLKFAFEELNFERVEFRADKNNERSINAMKSIGCSVEGILRNNYTLRNGKRRDSIVLSIIKNDWFNTVKEMLSAKLKMTK